MSAIISSPPVRAGASSSVLTACLIAALAVVPFVTENRFYLHLGNLVFINLLLVTGLGIIVKAGQLSLCHAAFAGLGAYASSLLALHGMPTLLAISGAVAMCAVAAYFLGKLVLRLRGVYFVLVTFLMGQIFSLLVLDFSELTRGANGLVNIPPVSLFGLALTTPRLFYWFSLAVAVLVSLLAWALLRSSYGRSWSSIEENHSLAEASGLDTRRYQGIAFTIGSAIAGLSGALVAHYVRFISPDTFTFWETVGAIVMLVVGGKGSLGGWALGAAFITPLPEILRETKELQHILYGGILIAVLMFLPSGLVSLVRRLRHAFRGESR
ncbi:MAG: branched-chain amino acid ABC transporter permease [Ottowia sp.]|uniref:branched-chain amino acid ABC transporter permease n=1 Tax=Ottowia sp. TaxID=1898956 RepID=UPI003C79489A